MTFSDDQKVPWYSEFTRWTDSIIVKKIYCQQTEYNIYWMQNIKGEFISKLAMQFHEKT